MRIALAALAALYTSTTPVMAQMTRPCGNPVDIAQKLAAEYRETATATGVDSRGNLVTIYSNPETGTWTVIVFSPTAGCALVAASGEGWTQREYVAPVEGKPS